MRTACLPVVASLLVACVGAEHSQRRASGTEDQAVALELKLDGARLDATLAAISSVAGVAISSPEREVGERTVTLHSSGLAWRDALARVADEADCAVVASGAGFAVQPIPAVTIQFTEASVRDVLELLGAYVGVPIDVDADVGGTLTLDLKELPWDQALAAVVRAAGLHSARQGERVRVAAGPVAGLPVTANPEPVGEVLPGRRVTIALDHSSRPPHLGPGREPWFEIDVEADNEDLAEVMERIGRQVDANILVSPEVKETLSVSLRGIPWRLAVDVIARMTRTEVEERAGGVLLLSHQSCGGVTIQFTRAKARTLIQLLAAYGGLDVIVTPQVPQCEVTVKARGAGLFPRLIESICRATGLVCERLGRVIVVSTRSYGGSPDLDGRQPAAPSPAEGHTPLRVRARGASLPILLALLTEYAERDLVTGPLAGRVDLSLDDTPADAALDALLEAVGAASSVEGNLLVVSELRGGPGSAPVVVPLQLPDGRVLALALQATIVPDPATDEPSSVVIDDRFYRPGDMLLDSEDQELDGVRVLEVLATGVRLRVEGAEILLPFP